MRREQIHKLACNHNISKDMELKPMAGSETAVCWFANDFAEGETKLEHLAIRFKTAETKDLFKKTFEESQQMLSDAPPSPAGGSGVQNINPAQVN